MHHYSTELVATPALVARFWAKVDKNGPTPARCPELGPCWMWQAATNKDGYGIFTVGRSAKRAHRIAWALTYGQLVVGLGVLHHCDTPSCVNPTHLFTGTDADNIRDMFAKGRQVTWIKATGGHNGTHTHEERRPYGVRNGNYTQPHKRPRGEAHPAAVLTAMQVEEIRARYRAGGVSHRALGRTYGVSHATIGYIVRGEVWNATST